MKKRSLFIYDWGESANQMIIAINNTTQMIRSMRSLLSMRFPESSSPLGVLGFWEYESLISPITVAMMHKFIRMVRYLFENSLKADKYLKPGEGY